VKCTNCGVTGHTKRDCVDTVTSPCHLCAGRDHEAGDCPNITCHRCGEFGHHIRTCNNPKRYSRAVICTLCGSCYHDSKYCPSLKDKDPHYVLNGSVNESIRCMCCNEMGHAMCKSSDPIQGPNIDPCPRFGSSTRLNVLSTKINSSSEFTSTSQDENKIIFCPNCGEKGHHLDYSLHDQCQAPKYEAYLKFSQLSKYLDNYSSRSDTKQSRIEFYQSLVRSMGSGYFIVGLFCYICSYLLFVWLFSFIYALLVVVYVSHVEDRFKTPRL
jgi:hypothetical protein